jgi:hypothetical protein
MSYSVWLISDIKGRPAMRVPHLPPFERKDQAESVAKIWTADCRQYLSCSDLHYEAREDAPIEQEATT